MCFNNSNISNLGIREKFSKRPWQNRKVTVECIDQIDVKGGLMCGKENKKQYCG